MRLALALSALAHLLFGAALVSEAPPRNGRDVGIHLISARLEPPPAVATGAAVAENRETPPKRHLARRKDIGPENARNEASSPAPAARSTDAVQPLTLSRVPDATVYTARDLDRYPRPLAPFRISRTAGDGAGEVRLEILIDEHGIVQDMTFAGPAAPARMEAVRATLAATRFLPAEKDGRAVKSRLVLSVSSNPSGDEP